MKRLRIIAGPNGSGKSTIINALRAAQINGFPIDFGIYVNADDIASSLQSNTFNFTAFGLEGVTLKEVENFAGKYGLFRGDFNAEVFNDSLNIIKDKIVLTNLFF